jgi:hypothetical protein
MSRSESRAPSIAEQIARFRPTDARWYQGPVHAPAFFNLDPIDAPRGIPSGVYRVRFSPDAKRDVPPKDRTNP